MSESHIDLDHFRQKLIDLRDELEAAERVGNADADTVELDQQRQGRLSRMDALGAQAMTQATQQRRREALQCAHKALARIDSGDYGLCVECDGEIDPRRLEFDPAALMCITCAGKAEG